MSAFGSPLRISTILQEYDDGQRRGEEEGSLITWRVASMADWTAYSDMWKAVAWVAGTVESKGALRAARLVW